MQFLVRDCVCSNLKMSSKPPDKKIVGWCCDTTILLARRPVSSPIHFPLFVTLNNLSY